MPELPEVETVRRILKPQLAGRRIVTVAVDRPEIVAHPSADEFVRAVVQKTVTDMRRRGKFLSLALSDGGSVWLHLRMTGALLVTPADLPPEKHTHLIFGLNDGKELRFSDQRRFGRFWYLAAGEEDRYTGTGRLGPEPDTVTAVLLEERLGGKRRMIKDCLLDQSLIAGIGNIHGDEILYLAGIAPDRPAESLSGPEWEKLAEAIPEELETATERLAMTPEEYLAGRGREYRDEPYFQAYGREGKPCLRCGTAIRRITVAGRGSSYCPKCQK